MTQPSNRTTNTPHNAGRNHATHAPVVVSVDARPLPKAVHPTPSSQPAVPTIAMVLGGGRGLRRIDPDQSEPLALMPLGDGQAENAWAWANDDTGLASGGRVLDWVLHALGERGMGRSSVRFVGGYHVQKVLARYPGLRFCFDGQWPQHGPVQALAVGLAAEWGEAGSGNVSGNASGNWDEKPLPAMVVAETAGVFRASAVATLEQAGLDIALACVPVDRSRVPASQAKQAPVEPMPLVWLSPKAVAVLCNNRQTLAELPVDMGWSAWAQWLVACGEQENVSLTSGAVPTDAAAVLSDASGLAKFVLGTKAMTLARLQPLVKQSVVLDQVAFTVAEWAADRVGCIQRIQQTLGDGLLVVRSSAVQEDGWHASAAGQYDSVLDVPASSNQLVGQAVDRVVSAYGRKGHDQKLVADCQVLVQPQMVDVLASGVVLTADAKTNAPQRTISVDSTSGRTDSVTAGDDHRVQNLVVRRGKRSARLLQTVPWLAALLDAIDELEALVGHDRLDIEFAVGPSLDAGSGNRHLIHVLQVRPLAGGSAGEAAKDHVSQADVDEQLDAVAEHLQRLASKGAHRLPGNPTQVPVANKAPLPGVPGAGVLGNMPDWNPAEMVGTAPRGLALSLYQTLITDGVWAEARAQMGHRDVTGTPLLVALAGQPYIDVKASFASFLPAGLDEAIAEKAVYGALQRLAEHPEWHDKVEFAVMPTCAHADKSGFELRCKQLGLDASETAVWWDALAKHLKQLVGGKAGNMDQTMAEQDRLQNVLDAWAWARGWEQAENNGGNGREPVGLEDHAQALWQVHRACQAFGTLPFAKMARHGFVAVTLLQSLVAVGALAESEASAFCRSLPTVAGDMAELLAAVKRGAVDKQTFVQSHGHLRPGTYDLLSPSYRETVDQLLAVTTGMDGAASGGDAENTAKDAFHAGIASGGSGGGGLVAMNAALQRALGGHAPSAEAVLAYIAQAIPGREKAKFVFTKAVDAMLGHVAAMGALLGMDKALACELPISAYLRLATDPPTPDVVKELQRRAAGLAKKHRVTRAVRLPALIVSPEDVAGFAMLDAQPNFITRQSVTADVVVLSENQGPQNVSGKIVVIENADPGFDWLFAAGIAGLVTKHGGAASHMAIRATEFDLPAAIGCGALVHAKAARAKRLMLDCSSHRMWGMDANGHWPVHGGDVTGLV